MSGHGLRLIEVVPAARNYRTVLQSFGSKNGGIVCAQSAHMLRVLADLLDDEDPMRCEPFASIPRFALQALGLPAAPLASAGLINACIGIAIKSLPDDSPFAASRGHRGTHREIERVVSLLRNYRIAPERLAELSTSAATPEATRKWSDLAKIGMAVEASLNRLGFEYHASHLIRAIDSPPKPGAVEEAVIVFEADELTPLQLEFLAWLQRCGTSVTLVAPCQRHANSHLFKNTGRLRARFPSERISAEGEPNWIDHIFGPPSKVSDAKLEIHSHPSALVESEWTLRGAHEAVQDGTKPDRVAIVVRDLDTYAPLLQSTARRFGIPLTLPRRVPVFTSSYARSIAALLDLAQSHDPLAVTPLARRMRKVEGIEAADELAKALASAAIDGEDGWKALSLVERTEEDPLSWLGVLAKWITDNRGASHPLAEWSKSFGDLVLKLAWLPTMANAERHLRAWNAMLRALADDARASLGIDEPITLSLFAEHCHRLWEVTDASVPQQLGSIRVATQPEELGEVDVLFGIGFLEGSFPRRRRENPVLDDFELAELSRLEGLEPALPNSRDEAEAERDRFFRVCAATNGSLCLSFPRVTGDRDGTPAFYLTEAAEAAGGVDIQEHSSRTLTPPIAEARIEADQKLAAALEGSFRVLPANEFTVAAVRHRVLPPAEHLFAPWELQTALRCSFQSLARDRLRLRSGSRRERWELLRDLPERARLLACEDPEEARYALESALAALFEAHRGELPDWERRIMQAGASRLIDGWIVHEFQARETWPRVQGSLRVGVQFGESGLAGANAKLLPLAGRVAGISRTGDYATAHIVRRSIFQKPRELSDPDALLVGLYFRALGTSTRGVALDVESIGGDRQLLFASRDPILPSPNAAVGQGLQRNCVLDQDDPRSYEKFFERVDALAAKALERLRAGDAGASPGDYCERCDFGALCRQSLDFGTSEASEDANA